MDGPAAAVVHDQRNPFRTSRYSLWWAATVTGAMGVGFQVVTVPLFVRDRVSEDNRAIAIAFALICQAVPSAVLLLIGGVVADRAERQKVMMRVYAVAAVVSLSYVFLSGFDVRAVWPVFILGAVIGSVDAFGQPARVSMTPQLVSQAQLQNAIILGTIAFMAAGQFFGPAVAGVLADGPGLTAAFSAEVLFLVVAALIASRIGIDRPVPTGKSIRGDLVDGLQYVRRSPVLLGLLVLYLMPGLFLMGPFRVTSVLIVDDVLHESDKYVGIFSACFGVGVIAGSFAMTIRRFGRRGVVLCGAPLLGGGIFVVYGASEVLLLSMVMLLVWGLSAALFINLATPLMQEACSRPMLGRVMSMSNLMFAVGTPLGFAQTGIVASIWGPQTAVIASGIIFASVGFFALAFLRPVRRLD